MINILLISHEGYASGSKKAVELIIGKQPNLYHHELNGEKGIEIFKNELNQKIIDLIHGNTKLIILSDLKNGTPYNCALTFIAVNELWNQIQLFTGMNLNLILEIILADEDVIIESNQQDILATAKEGIFLMNKKEWNTHSMAGEE
ncbi:PTS sugar transporter subunit IIA [Klebsiella sp. BIGb0407]|uniref:PTS sugar transporter subunit IIA n=1 Tax=Klebsiella sp. BIGb0407 TaxID=2940603 RepID=UPI0021670693|nr:PTS fructose transporter subunit IIA [Klebsiella sp. BIGb0407]MCS3432962.1 mannose/fructose-specific phosphotransferase system component IIA [Klebsiella sp. BIGb0407]